MEGQRGIWVCAKHVEKYVEDDSCPYCRIAALEALDNVVSAMSRINVAEAGKNAALEENKGLLVAIRRLEKRIKALQQEQSDECK